MLTPSLHAYAAAKYPLLNNQRISFSSNEPLSVAPTSYITVQSNDTFTKNAHLSADVHFAGKRKRGATKTEDGDLEMLDVPTEFQIEGVTKIQKIHRAAQKGDLTKIQKWFDEGKSLEVKDGLRRTPLVWADAFGREKAKTKLLELGADIDSLVPFKRGGVKGILAIHKAAGSGDADKIIRLVQSDSSLLNKPDGLGRTPLIWAAALGQLNAAKTLLSLGADKTIRDNSGTIRNNSGGLSFDSGALPLMWAEERRHDDVAQLLRSSDATQESESPKEELGKTELHEAAKREDLDTLRSFNAEPKRLNETDRDKRTPLIWAAAFGAENSVRLLLSFPLVRRDKRDKDGCLPIHYAAEKGFPNIIDLLKDDVNATDYQRRSVAHYAAHGGQPYVVERLHRYRVNFNTRDEVGRTPIHMAADRDETGDSSQEKSAEVLIKLWLCGADPLATVIIGDMDTGKTAAHLAAECGNLPVLKALASIRDQSPHRADLQDILTRPDAKGRTPLAWANKKGHDDVVKFLKQDEAEQKQKLRFTPHTSTW